MALQLFSSEFIGYIVCLSFNDYVLLNITSALRITSLSFLAGRICNFWSTLVPRKKLQRKILNKVR